MSSSKRDAACRALNDKAHLQSYTAHPELNICSCKPDLHGMPFEHCVNGTDSDAALIAAHKI